MATETATSWARWDGRDSSEWEAKPAASPPTRQPLFRDTIKLARTMTTIFLCIGCEKRTRRSRRRRRRCTRRNAHDAATRFDWGISLSLKSPKSRHPLKIRGNILYLVRVTVRVGVKFGAALQLPSLLSLPALAWLSERMNRKKWKKQLLFAVPASAILIV